MYIPDGHGHDYDSGKVKENFYAWGWLGGEVEKRTWPSDMTKGLFLKALNDIQTTDFYMGWHTCEMCGAGMAEGFNGSKVFVTNGITYKCPEAAAHYITEHGYCPPLEVINALVGEEKDIAKTIVEEIIYDLTSRGGFQNTWDGTDEDIQEEIIEAWEDIVKSNLP